MSPTYSYKAKNKSGNEIDGSITAEDTSMVARELKEQGYYITSIEKVEQQSSSSLNIDLSFLKSISTEELAVFSQQFSVMINAGIPLIDSLDIVKEQSDNKKFQNIIDDLISKIEAGKSLSEALKNHPKVFPDFYSNLIEAGETGGILDEVLSRLTSYYRRLNEINKEIKSALYYPIIILIVAVGCIIFLLTSVVPNIVGMFKNQNIRLPLPTRILLGLSNFMQNYWWLVIGALLLIIIGSISYFRTSHGRYIFGKIILKIPIAGPLVRKIAISRFSSTLSILLSSGVNVLSALAVVEEVVNNSVIADCIIETRNRLREGVNISQPLEESGEFPPMVIQMIKIGEETGSLDQMLSRVAEFYDHEVETSIEGTISLIEPIMIVFLALIVGFIAISIIMPLFEMYSMIG